PGRLQRLVMLARLQPDDPRLLLRLRAPRAKRTWRAILAGEAGLENGSPALSMTHGRRACIPSPTIAVQDYLAEILRRCDGPKHPRASLRASVSSDRRAQWPRSANARESKTSRVPFRLLSVSRSDG